MIAWYCLNVTVAGGGGRGKTPAGMICGKAEINFWFWGDTIAL